MLGKLITHEFAFGIQFPGHAFPPARNPWNREHIPGGSSSGSGAALAAGLAVGSLGTDTGGSIRGPAAFSRHRGPQADLRPLEPRRRRHALVDPRPHRADGAHRRGLRVPAPGARGPRPRRSRLQPRAGRRLPVRGSRRACADCASGVPRAYFFDGESRGRARLRGGARSRSASWARRRGREIPSIRTRRPSGHPARRGLRLPRARPARARPALRRGAAGEAAGGRPRHRSGVCAGAAAARSAPSQIARDLRAGRRAGHADDAEPAPPFIVVQDPDYGFPRSNMAPFNMSRPPRAGPPVRVHDGGLPLSLQLAGRPFDEATVLRVGHAYQQATDWHVRRPPV